MFPSISQCARSSDVYTHFTATTALNLDISSSVKIFIDDVETTQRPIAVAANQKVTAKLTSPANYAQYRIIPYKINNAQLSFVVVNEKQVANTFTPEGLSKRWYNFEPDVHQVSYYDLNNLGIRNLGFNDVPLYLRSERLLKDFSKNNLSILNADNIVRKDITDEEFVPNEIYFNNNYLLINETQKLKLSNSDFSIEAWVKPIFSTFNIEKFICGTASKSKTGNITGWALSLDENKVKFYISQSSYFEIKSEDAITEDAWTHIVVSRVDNEFCIWLNGVANYITESSISDNSSNSFKIGSLEDKSTIKVFNNPETSFKGYISTLRISIGSSVYTHGVSFSPPSRIVTATQNTALLTLQENPNSLLEIIAVPDPITSCVYFYNKYGQLLENLKLPSSPVQVEKISLVNETFFAVSCLDNSIYKVTLDKNALNKIALSAKGVSSGRPLDWLFELAFETDVPFFGSFAVYANYKRKSKSIANPNSIYFDGQFIWVGGNRAIWKLNTQFEIIEQITVNGIITGFVAKNNVVIASFKDGTLKRIKTDGSTPELIFQGSWISPPVIYKNKIWISDSLNLRLIAFTVDDNYEIMSSAFVLLGNFNPSYLTATADFLYISGHDSNTIKVFNSQDFTSAALKEKAAKIYAVQNALFISHIVKDSNVLAHASASIIPLETQRMYGGMVTMGCKPQKIKSKGSTTISIIVPSGITYWVDGIPNVPLYNGAMLSVSANVSRVGAQQYPIIIGDSAFDFYVEATQNNYYPRLPNFEAIINDSKIAQAELEVPEYASEFKATVDYGYILKNNMPYYGDTTFSPGDIIKICVPFGSKINSTVVKATLGSKYYFIPIKKNSAEKIIFSRDDLPKNDSISFFSTASVGGAYYLPLDNTVNVYVNGQPKQQATTHTISKDDTILIVATASSRIYDEKQYAISGPSTLSVRYKTQGVSYAQKTQLQTIVSPNIGKDYYFKNLNAQQMLSQETIDLFTTSSKIKIAKIPQSTTNTEPPPPLPELFILNNPDEDLDYVNSLTISNTDIINVKRTVANAYEKTESIYFKYFDSTFNEYVPIDFLLSPIVNDVYYPTVNETSRLLISAQDSGVDAIAPQATILDVLGSIVTRGVLTASYISSAQESVSNKFTLIKGSTPPSINANIMSTINIATFFESNSNINTAFDIIHDNFADLNSVTSLDIMSWMSGVILNESTSFNSIYSQETYLKINNLLSQLSGLVYFDVERTYSNYFSLDTNDVILKKNLYAQFNSFSDDFAGSKNMSMYSKLNNYLRADLTEVLLDKFVNVNVPRPPLLPGKPNYLHIGLPPLLQLNTKLFTVPLPLRLKHGMNLGYINVPRPDIKKYIYHPEVFFAPNSITLPHHLALVMAFGDFTKPSVGFATALHPEAIKKLTGAAFTQAPGILNHLAHDYIYSNPLLPFTVKNSRVFVRLSPSIIKWSRNFAAFKGTEPATTTSNYPLIIKYEAILNKEYVFINDLDIFYGFFNTREDAITSAVVRKLTPYLAYKIPGTNYWTYRRVYVNGDFCSVYDPPRFYVQGA